MKVILLVGLLVGGCLCTEQAHRDTASGNVEMHGRMGPAPPPGAARPGAEGHAYRPETGRPGMEGLGYRPETGRQGMEGQGYRPETGRPGMVGQGYRPETGRPGMEGQGYRPEAGTPDMEGHGYRQQPYPSQYPPDRDMSSQGMDPRMGPGMPPPGMFMPPPFRGRGMPPMMDPGPMMAIKRLQEELAAKDHQIAQLKSVIDHQKIHPPEQDFHSPPPMSPPHQHQQPPHAH